MNTTPFAGFCRWFVVTSLIALSGLIFLTSTRNSMAEQTTDFTTAAYTSPISASQLPAIGTYYSAQHPDWPPIPGNVWELPAWSLGNGIFLLDDSDFDYAYWAQELSAISFPSGGVPMSFLAHGSNELWLAINGAEYGCTDNTVDLTIHTPEGSTNASWDLYFTSALGWTTEWRFLMRCPTNIIAQTNVFARYLCDDVEFFMAREVATNCDLIVTTNVTPQQMAEMLVPPWVTLTNVSFTGAAVARGVFTNGNCCGLPVDSGIILSSGNITNAIGPNNRGDQSEGVDGPSDSDLNLLLGGSGSRDAAVLEFDLIATNAFLLQFKFVYASEEYPEWCGANYNDPVAIFVTTNSVGTNWVNSITNNIALVPGSTNLPVTVNTVSGGFDDYGDSVPAANPQFYVDNHDPDYNQSIHPNSMAESVFNVQYDGMTVLLLAEVYIDSHATNHIKIAIADYTDTVYDSAVFLGAWHTGLCP